jgi:hypothetical protein
MHTCERRAAFCAITLLQAATMATAALAPVASAQSPWTDLARRDLAAMRETILAHHPGPVDPLNPGYRRWLDDGYRQALAMTDSIKDANGLIAVLSFYTSGFEDGHLGWGSDFVRRTVAWPGIVVAWRRNRFVVDHVAGWLASGDVRVGDEVTACDGMPLERRLVEHVMKFAGGIPSMAAWYGRLAPEVLIDDGNPWRGRPAVCHVRRDGGGHQISLSWRQIERQELTPLLDRAAFGPSPGEFSLRRPTAELAWVTIPSFAENVDDNRTGLERVIASVPAVRDARWIVFDVRGNRGGNSAWGRLVLAALLGEAYADSLADAVDGDAYVEWRASADNAAFIERATLPRYQPGSAQHAQLRRLVDTLRAAAAAGATLVEWGRKSRTVERGRVREHPLGTRIVLLTDGWCASACLDFADLVLAVPGARHAGAATSADAVYIDNRAVALPSGFGLFGFSMKVWRNRTRTHNQPYVPTLVYPGDRWETAALQSWLIGALRAASPSQTR